MASSPRVAVIDYGSGNLRSVEKALQRAGADVARCGSPDALGGCSAVVLPGVGSFGDCARNLEQRGLSGPLRAWLAEDRPYLGICLGYQILFEGSEESPGTAGLSHWPGRVVKFPVRSGLKVPHMGWNNLQMRSPDLLFRGLPGPAWVYFVHSYFPAPDDSDLVTASCAYDGEFAAACARGRVHGVQFHPEKSQTTGLRILENFVAGVAGANS